MNGVAQQLNNSVVWAIVLLAIICYSLLAEFLMDRQKNASWQQKVNIWLSSLQVMLSCLPLLGLLGTIVGLLSTFSQLSAGAVDQQMLLTGGIADAMLTTQMGLLLVIPGWLLLAKLKQQLHWFEVAAFKGESCVQS